MRRGTCLGKAIWINCGTLSSIWPWTSDIGQQQSKLSIWCVTVHCTILVVFAVHWKMCFIQGSTWQPGTALHDTELYLVHCPVSSVQLVVQRERGDPLEEPDGAAATDQPLAGPGHSRFHTVQCTHCTAQWLLSVSTHVHCSTHSYSLTAKLILFDKSTLFTFYVYTRFHYKLSFQVLAL